MRTLGLALIALLIFWGAAQAQTAAPRLNPFPFGPFSASNPAVLSWDGPSRIGVGLADSSLDFTALGAATIEAAAGNGNAAQIRLVGESFAFGVDYWSLNMDIIASLGGGSFDLNNTLIGAAYQMDELFSLGVGVASSESIFSTDLTTGSLPLAGATVRLGEVVYLGFAMGTEAIESENTSVPGSAAEGDRDVTRIGAGYYSRDGENGLHVEGWREEIDGINTATLTEDAEETTGFTLEVVFSNILAGYEINSSETLNPVDGSVLEEQDGATVSLGWVPMEGLNIVISITEVEIFNRINFETLNFNIAFAGATWAF